MSGFWISQDVDDLTLRRHWLNLPRRDCPGRSSNTKNIGLALALAACMLFNFSCNQVAGLTGTKRTEKNAADPDEAGKPSDGGERLPGFLTDPALIIVDAAGADCWNITGKPGAVGFDGASVDELKVRILGVANDHLTASPAGSASTYQADPLATSGVGSAGDFALITPVCFSDGLIVIAVGSVEETAAEWTVGDSDRASSAAFNAQTGGSVTLITAADAGEVLPGIIEDQIALTTVTVRTPAELESALQADNTMVVLEPGVYEVDRTLVISGRRNLILQASSSDVGATIIEGSQSVNTGISIQDSAAVRLEGFTVSHFLLDGVALLGTNSRITLRSIIFHGMNNAGVRADLSAASENIVLENSTVELDEVVTVSSALAAGVLLSGGTNWVIRNNTFRNLWQETVLGPAVGLTKNANSILVESNIFIECQRNILLGDPDGLTAPDVRNAIIRNNFIARTDQRPGDAGISIWGATDVVVAHNSITLGGSFMNTIEYRYSSVAKVSIANNLTDGPIMSRDEATATLTDNVLDATLEMFVDPSAADLHLKRPLTGLKTGAFIPGAPSDIDGEPRSSGDPVTAGADEP